MHNCCVAPKVHTTSQVTYLKGTGGVELHLHSSKTPFNSSFDHIDYDVVFRDEVDTSTFALYVGCGGCLLTDDVHADRMPVQYQTPVVEPFTQGFYRSLVPEENRQFPTSLLSEEACSEGHFTIRMVDFGNRSDGAAIVWGPVIGLDEPLIPEELLRFPIYIIRNHGSAWSDLPWTLPLCCIIAFVVVVGWQLCNVAASAKRRPVIISLREVGVREYLYVAAMFFFAVAALEETVHVIYAQSHVPVAKELGIALLIIIVSQCLPLAITWLLWQSMIEYRCRDSSAPKTCLSVLNNGGGGCWPGLGHDCFFFLEAGFAAGLLFLLGSGFLAGPALIGIASLVRGLQLACVAAESKKRTAWYRRCSVVANAPPPQTAASVFKNRARPECIVLDPIPEVMGITVNFFDNGFKSGL